MPLIRSQTVNCSPRVANKSPASPSLEASLSAGRRATPSSPSCSKNPFRSIKAKIKAFTQTREDDKNAQHQVTPQKLTPNPSRRKSLGAKENINPATNSHSKKTKDLEGNRGDGTRRGNNLLKEFNNVGSTRSYLKPLEGLCCAAAKVKEGQSEEISESDIVDSEVKKDYGVNGDPVRDPCPPPAPASDEANRIMVYVRVRPISRKEKDAGARSCVSIVSDRTLKLEEIINENDYLRIKRPRSRQFTFDALFPDHVGQEEVYKTSTAELVDGVLQGRNASVFCYGATGAGKTHTMLGTVESPGVMVLALKDLFSKLEQYSHNGDHLVHLSYLEVYNELVIDLLSPGKPLDLREDKQVTVVSGLTYYPTHSVEEVMTLLHRGNRNRTTEPTRINETSSRSHAILQVLLQYNVKEGSNNLTRTGKLSLIDLAGSERATATDQRTLRTQEGANINKSLLAVSSCIKALVEGQKHIPYRNSKLTQLLKDSLGGSCQTAMIANVSPSHLSYSETQNTLHWADRAKEIRTKPCTVNEEFEMSESQIEQTKHLLEVEKENEQLRIQVAQLQQQLHCVESQKQNSTPSRSCPSPVIPSTYIPTTVVKITCNGHLAKNLKSFTFQQIGRHELSKNVNGKTVDQIIEELRKTAYALEEESGRMKTESAMKERQLAASVAYHRSVIRKYNMQLKNKDEFIRQLCQRAYPMKHTHPEAPGHDQMILGNASVLLNASKKEARKYVSPTQNVYQQSPKSGRKRPFWDINNGNSPETAQSRARLDTSNAPSMLLQPGIFTYNPRVVEVVDMEDLQQTLCN